MAKPKTAKTKSAVAQVKNLKPKGEGTLTDEQFQTVQTKLRPNVTDQAEDTTPSGSRAGVPNVKDVDVVALSRCRDCHSTDRTEYKGTKTEFCLTTVRGLPVSRIIRSRCKCKNCGKARIDVVHEYHPEDEGK